MLETQLSFWDVSAAREYQHKQKDAELDALLIQHVGAKAAKKWHQTVAAQQAKLNAFLNQPQTPDQIAKRAASRERIFANVQATTNPLKNPYALLGVESGATKRDIMNAYRRKARKLHPDVGGNEEDFKRLHEAYRTILKQAPKE